MSGQTEALQPTPANTVGKQVDRHEKALLQGDLSDLSNQERKSFYTSVCESLGLNPLTSPLEYIWLSGDLTLYANKTAANQLRKLNDVSITHLDIQQDSGLHTVYAYAQDEAGRTDVDAGIVDVSGKRGEALANAKMKAITKAKRRVTLSICGLGFLDETEVEDIPDGATEAANVDTETGEIRTRKSDSWYEQATESLKDKVREGMDPAQILAYADEAPTSHPIDDWPDEKSEPLIEWLKEGERPGESDSGKAQGTSPSGNGEASKKNEDAPQQKSSAPTPSERKYDGPEGAISRLCASAKEAGMGEAPPEDERISEAQRNRLYAIAKDHDWKDSWLDRLIKDELGFESKKHIPWGDPYDEICEALEDQELKFWMSRDPDTVDMEFEDDDPQEAFEDPDDSDDLPF